MSLEHGRWLATTVLTSALLSAPSFATAAILPFPPAPAQSQAVKATAQPRPATVEDVVVTGSRLHRNLFEGTQPISIIANRPSQVEGLIDTTDILQSSEVAGAAGQIHNYFTGYVVVGGAGAYTVSLRGLGADRPLVLINGRRMGPAGIRDQVGAIDLNALPGGQVDRVEILTDGAASIYGSDAVGGVINVITKTNPLGRSMSAQVTRTFETGGEDFRIEASHGWTSSRGYLTVGAEYYERQPALAGQRKAFAWPQSRAYYDAELSLKADVNDPSTGDYKCGSGPTNRVTAFRFEGVGQPSFDYQLDPGAVEGGGLIGCGLAGWRFNAGGIGTACASSTQAPQVQRGLYAASNTHPARYDRLTATAPVTRYSLSAFGAYDLTANTEAFGELILVHRQSVQSFRGQLSPTVKYGAKGYPYASLHALSPRLDYAMPVADIDRHEEQTLRYTRAVAGLRGRLTLGRDFDWEVAGRYSQSDSHYGRTITYADRLFATSGYHEGLSLDGIDLIPAGFATAANEAEFANTGCVTAWLWTATAGPTGGIDFFSPAFLQDSDLAPEAAAPSSTSGAGGRPKTAKQKRGLQWSPRPCLHNDQ